MKKSSMFEKYPDVVEVDDLRKMLVESVDDWRIASWLNRRSDASR